MYYNFVCNNIFVKERWALMINALVLYHLMLVLLMFSLPVTLVKEQAQGKVQYQG